MDCKTARQMFEFARPWQVELEPSDLRDLEAHLAACPDCGRAAQQERAFDEHLGRALRQVEVPDRLRARLLNGLAAERAALAAQRRKRWLSGSLAAAAALLIALGGWLWYHEATYRPLDLDALVRHIDEDAVSPPDAAKLEEIYRQQGVRMEAPTAFNYAFLTYHGMGELQKEQVPCLIFFRNDDAANIHAEAKVYVVSDRQFDLKNLHDQAADGGYRYKIEINRESGAHFAYVIVHTGENLDWLRRHEGAGE